MADINKTYIYETVLVSGTTSGGTTTGTTFTFGPEIFEIQTSENTSYIGYGQLNACKIRQVITISGSTYTAYWSNGEESLNKIWDNRLTYSYF